MSKASPKLLLACATGEHIKEANFTARKSGQLPVDFLKIKLTDVLVSSYQTGGSGDVLPMDQLSLNFAKIEFSYYPQRPDGSLEAPITVIFDRKTNTAG
jgi:type VI secretion system secreted protein Hcp